MFTKDPGGCLGVNARFPNEDLDEEESTRSVTNVPIRVPSLDLAESRESQGGHSALDNLDVFLSSSGLEIDKGVAIGQIRDKRLDEGSPFLTAAANAADREVVVITMVILCLVIQGNGAATLETAATRRTR